MSELVHRHRPSPNCNERALPVSMVVLHYTGMRSADEALARLCDEQAQVSAHYMIDEDGTVITRAHSGKPNRMIANDFTRSWTGREAEIKPYPHQLKDVGEAASYRGRIEGDVTHGVLPCGQSAGLISQVERAATVVENIARQATDVLSRLPRAG